MKRIFTFLGESSPRRHFLLIHSRHPSPVAQGCVQGPYRKLVSSSCRGCRNQCKFSQFRSMLGYPGLRHFKNNISFVSQWTGREHKEMERVFVTLLAGAVQPAVLRTVIAVVDFIYYAQLQKHTSKTLQSMETALKKFHDNKDIFIREGI